MVVPIVPMVGESVDWFDTNVDGGHRRLLSRFLHHPLHGRVVRHSYRRHFHLRSHSKALPNHATRNARHHLQSGTFRFVNHRLSYVGSNGDLNMYIFSSIWMAPAIVRVIQVKWTCLYSNTTPKDLLSYTTLRRGIMKSSTKTTKPWYCLALFIIF